MPNFKELQNLTPVAPLKLAVHKSCQSLAQGVNDYLVSFRKETPFSKNDVIEFNGYVSDNFIVKSDCPRFGSGEAKGNYFESIRGCDLFVMADVCNYSLTYSVCGHTNHMSPDDIYQDMKRLISAATGKAHRINVIMPFLYESRQHKRTKRESLDCSLALTELANMGVSNIITFDAHDPRVNNAIPLKGFDNFTPQYQFLKTLLNKVPDLQIDNNAEPEKAVETILKALKGD